MGNYVDVWKNSFNYSGRARRKEYWMFTLINMLIYIALSVVLGMISSPDSMLGAGVVLIFALAAIFPAIAVGVRRLHDTSRSGWWMLISLVPLIGGIWFLVLMVLDSKPETNQWGPSPKYAGSTAV